MLGKMRLPSASAASQLMGANPRTSCPTAVPSQPSLLRLQELWLPQRESWWTWLKNCPGTFHAEGFFPEALQRPRLWLAVPSIRSRVAWASVKKFTLSSFYLRRIKGLSELWSFIGPALVGWRPKDSPLVRRVHCVSWFKCFNCKHP